MKRSLVLLGAAVALAALGVTYSVMVSRPATVSADDDTVGKGQILFRDSGGEVSAVSLADPGGERKALGMRCHRFATAAGTSVCLEPQPGLVPKTNAVILDERLHETRRVELAGIPSRAQVSASGHMISWTVFVTGDSYNAGGFSTWTGILDKRSGYLIINMENIQLYKDGQRYHSPDVNYWGVTFASDDNRFYATVSTRGSTYLVEGDYAKWQATVIASNVECPSLSPDGKRVAFKKRVSPTSWRLAMLDLNTGQETLLAETASIDDQAAWLDNETVMYAKGADVWAATANGLPRLLLSNASSPAISPP